MDGAAGTGPVLPAPAPSTMSCEVMLCPFYAAGTQDRRSPWQSRAMAARLAHNQKAGGSSPPSAIYVIVIHTPEKMCKSRPFGRLLCCKCEMR